MALADGPYESVIADVLLTGASVVELEWGGFTVLRLCEGCGQPRRSGKDAIGAWHCTTCGRRST